MQQESVLLHLQQQGIAVNCRAAKRAALNSITATLADFRQWGITAFTADFLSAELPEINRYLIAAFLRTWDNIRYNGSTAFFVLRQQEQQILSSGFSWNYSGKTQQWRSDLK